MSRPSFFTAAGYRRHQENVRAFWQGHNSACDRFWEGRMAHRKRKARTSCPYLGDDAKAWFDGWDTEALN